MRHLLLASVGALLAACTMTQVATLDTANYVLQSPDGATVQLVAEVADEPEEQTRGLMFRQSLAQDHGMIFVYDSAASRTFWMKNTLIPLDIAFFDNSGFLVHKTTMTPCESDPCETYPSMYPARFILEMDKGWLEQHGVEEGWKLIRQ